MIYLSPTRSPNCPYKSPSAEQLYKLGKHNHGFRILTSMEMSGTFAWTRTYCLLKLQGNILNELNITDVTDC